MLPSLFKTMFQARNLSIPKKLSHIYKNTFQKSTINFISIINKFPINASLTGVFDHQYDFLTFSLLFFTFIVLLLCGI